MRQLITRLDDALHTRLKRMEGTEPVVTSELAWLEFASAVHVAARHQRLRQPGLVLDRFDADCSDDDGPITLLRLDVPRAPPLAQQLIREHRLHTLDAIHLAVASTDGVDLAAGAGLTVITRDDAQAGGARAMGLVTE